MSDELESLLFKRLHQGRVHFVSVPVTLLHKLRVLVQLPCIENIFTDSFSTYSLEASFEISFLFLGCHLSPEWSFETLDFQVENQSRAAYIGRTALVCVEECVHSVMFLKKQLQA